MVPGLPALMQRSPAVLTGEWWRLTTPIFINRPDSAELILNLVALLAVGVLAEWCWGGRRWLLFYFVSGLIGESAGLAWRPTGMGSSVAVCGLCGHWPAGFCTARRPLEPALPRQSCCSSGLP
jgi:rhomboid protease GluP